MPNTSISELKEIVVDQGKEFLDFRKTLRQVHAKVDSIATDVGRLQPRTYLPPLRKPTQGIDFSRNFNVSAFIDAETKEQNNDRIGPKYLEFEPNVTHETLNADAMRCLEGLFHTYLPTVYGTCTWNEACKKEKVMCENVIREASSMPELAVFAQGSFWWPIRELAKQKFKSSLRANKQSSRTSARTIRQKDIRPKDAACGSTPAGANGSAIVGHDQLENADADENTIGCHDREISFMPVLSSAAVIHQNLLREPINNRQTMENNQHHRYRPSLDTGSLSPRDKEAVVQAQDLAAAERLVNSGVRRVPSLDHMKDTCSVPEISRLVQPSSYPDTTRGCAMTAINMYESCDSSDDKPIARIIATNQNEDLTRVQQPNFLAKRRCMTDRTPRNRFENTASGAVEENEAAMFAQSEETLGSIRCRQGNETGVASDRGTGGIIVEGNVSLVRKDVMRSSAILETISLTTSEHLGARNKIVSNVAAQHGNESTPHTRDGSGAQNKDYCVKNMAENGGYQRTRRRGKQSMGRASTSFIRTTDAQNSSRKIVRGRRLNNTRMPENGERT